MKKPVLDVVAILTVLLFFSANAWAGQVVAPDGGSSALLLSLAAAGLGVARRFLC